MQTNENQIANETTDRIATRPPDGAKKTTLIALLCLAVIAAGIAISAYLIRTQPKASRRPPAKMKPLVNVITVKPAPHTVVVQAMGTVVPAKELTLKSRVAGEIVAIHPEFIEGGLLKKGEQILQIDDVDYRLIVSQKQSAVADARYELKLEMGRQDIAKREWELLNGDNPTSDADSELALRKPHLEKAQLDLKAAEAELQAARLQLARTRLYAPFNAIVRSNYVEKGSQVAAQESLATLVNTDHYWVQVSVPIDQLRWIDIPGQDRQSGAEVRVQYHGGATRVGRVIKLLGDLENQGRMARLVISIEDPMGLKSREKGHPAMLIGEYVQTNIQGRRTEAAYRIPRAALRDQSSVWVAGKDGKLEIRDVRVIWRDTRTVLLKDGLQPGERVIVTDLATPVGGMAIEVENDRSKIQPALTAPNTSERG
jgi:RND family efflux transporter MFP subunit